MDLPQNADLSSFTLQGSESMDKIKEQNTYERFVWMENKKGRKVPVAIVHVKDALERGYIHTDKKINTEVEKDNIRFNQTPIETDPMKVMAKATESLAASQAAIAEKLGGEVSKKKEAKADNKKPE